VDERALTRRKQRKTRDKPQIPQISQMAEVKELGSHPLQEFILNKKVDGRDPSSSFSDLQNLRNLWFQIRSLG
jgi:hypothetical protein